MEYRWIYLYWYPSISKFIKKLSIFWSIKYEIQKINAKAIYEDMFSY